MFTRRLAQIACGAAVFGLAVSSSSIASSLAHQTNHLTFSGPVGLPGVTLPRGTYTFDVIDIDRRIVRVRNRDGSRVYFAGFTAIVDRPAGQRADRLVTLLETPRGVAPRIETWYPIGDSTGHRFIYPDTTR